MRILALFVFLPVLFSVSCAKKVETGEDPKVTTLGSIEATARLEEIRGELRNDPLYDYAHVMKYTLLEVHRGDVNM